MVPFVQPIHYIYVNDMVGIFTEIIEKTLDEIALNKSFTVRSNYRFGLSDYVKKLLKERDPTRSKIKDASTKEKSSFLQKYKTLINKVTSQIRKENIICLH